jgi:putative heme-binding domain-containing protein
MLGKFLDRTMTTLRLAGSLLVAVGATIVASVQQTSPQPAAGPPPLPPARGTLAISREAADAILAAIKAPAGFTVTPFAAPPIANYPACVTATHDGVVFVCVDRNGSLQTDADMGYIVRLIDKDRNGQADDYTVFATLDSPRGAVFDGAVLYVSHPPFVTALRDTDGDGVADDRRTLVRGLGFGLDFRGADHTTNGIEMGIDGWLYIAVGDYGFVKATGADGHEIQLRGGGNVRVRPDGTELEIYSRGTRNDYDLAIDPYLNLFARGNTNDGGGFDIRMYHFVAGATFGYPALFRNFSDEVVPPIADYGTGSGTGMLYVHDAGLPAPYGDALYSVDWGKNAVFRHALQPKGSTFAVTQEEFVTVPRPTDMAIDGSSQLYLASWDGGQFRYAGENVGYLVRLSHQSVKPTPPVDLSAASDARLVELVGSANLVLSRAAQAAVLRRGRSAERVAMLERRAGSGTLHGRVAAIFTLKQLAGADATPALTKLAADPAARAFALRALADRRGELSEASKPLFVRALDDPDPRVRLEAVTGLRRMGATDASAAMLPLTATKDAVISNVAINALASLSAIDAPLAAVSGTSDDLAAGALRVLQQIHQPAVVTGLISALFDTTQATRRRAILQALARLHNREGVWRGTLAEWWGTRPDTTGPYYDPIAWEESARIRGVLVSALLESQGRAPQADFSRLATDLQRNRVLPPGGAELLTALAADRHALLPDVVRALVGRVRLEVDATAGQLLDRVARAHARYGGAVVTMIVAAGPPTPAAAAILQSTAVDPAMGPELRASAFTALAASTGPDSLRRSIDAFSSLVAPTLEPPLEAVWTQFLSPPAHVENVSTWRELAASTDPARQRLAYAVLLQLAADPPALGRGTRGAGGGRGGGGAPGGRGGGGRGRGGPNQALVESARAEARSIIDAAWNAQGAANLVWAVGRTGAAQYRDRITAVASSPVAEMREAAAYAIARLDAVSPKTTPAATAAGPAVASIPYEELAGRVQNVDGDVALGRKLFAQQACSACHTSAPGEPEKGPYLGGILSRYSKAEVIESILRPSAKVAQGFATHLFTTTDKRQLAGFVVREGQDQVVLRDLTGAETTLRKSEIISRSVSEVSTMPPSLVDTLTLQELASLLAFLESTSAK